MRTHQGFPAPPLPSVPPAGAPALMVPKALLLPQFRRQAAVLPTRPRRPTAAERAEEVHGAALELLLHLRPPMPVAVVGAATVAKEDHPSTTNHLVVAAAEGAVVVEVAAVVAMTPALLKQRS